MFSEKVRSISESPIRKFASHSRKAKDCGKTVLPLNIGQPDIKTPMEYFEAIRSVDSSTVMAYTDSHGIDPLIKSFENYYKKVGMPYCFDDILITNGGSEALIFTFMCLCDPGEEVLVVEPYYANYNTMAKYASAKMVPVTSRIENDFRLPSYDEIEKKITDKTRAILITNPNNPTGLVYNRDEIERIVKIAKENDLYIISDEVYREFVYNGQQPISFTEYPEIMNKLIIIDSVSKRFSGCGIRIGCMVSKDHELLAQALKLCQSRLSVPFMEQIGAAALFNVNDSYINETIAEYKKRRDICTEYLAKIDGAQFMCPDGAFYIIVGLPVDDADAFTAWMLTDFDVNGETIMLCPAKDFYATPGKGINEVRISYCICCDKLKRAMNILAEGVKAYNAR